MLQATAQASVVAPLAGISPAASIHSIRPSRRIPPAGSRRSRAPNPLGSTSRCGRASAPAHLPIAPMLPATPLLPATPTCAAVSIAVVSFAEMPRDAAPEDVAMACSRE